MQEQYAFDFFRPLPRRPAKPERLFICLLPDPKTSHRLDQLAAGFIASHDLKERRLKPERFHLSLHHVADERRLRSQTVYAARQAAKAVSMAPFEVTLRAIAGFKSPPGRKRPLVLLGEGDELRKLNEVLGLALRKNGFKAEDHFNPHITLSYGSMPVGERAIEPIRFTAGEFFLIHSELWLTQYHAIDRWLLH